MDIKSFWNEEIQPCAAENYTVLDCSNERLLTLAVEYLICTKNSYDGSIRHHLTYRLKNPLELNLAVYAVTGLIDKDRLDEVRAAWKPMFRWFKMASIKAGKKLTPIIMPPHRFLNVETLDTILANLCALMGRKYVPATDWRIRQHLPNQLLTDLLLPENPSSTTDENIPRLIGHEDINCPISESPLLDFTPPEQAALIQHLSPCADFELNTAGLQDYLLNILFATFKKEHFWGEDESYILLPKIVNDAYVSVTVDPLYEDEDQRANEDDFSNTGFSLIFGSEDQECDSGPLFRIRYELNRPPII